ncbi:MAG: serine hydrolase domain-containing protein, partial [Acidimicrobiales bacterium]
VQSPPTAGPLGTSARLRDVDAYLRAEVERAQIPGVAVAVVDRGRVVFSRGYGRAAPHTPMTPNTPVVIGSTSKSITALATLQLVDAGRIDLDAPIGRYLPWFDPADGRATAITVRQLLIDTSGIPTWAGWSALAGGGRADEASTRRLLNDIRLEGPPGDRFRYSNANYIILGEIIESVTERSFPEVVDASIFQPLGMLRTAAAPPAGTVANRYWLGSPLRSHLPYLEVGIPAGAISSTAGDLARYLQAQLGQPSRGALTATNRALLHEPAVKAEGFGVPAGRRYAMGWYVGTVAGEPAVFHSGDVFDSSSSLVVLPEEDLGIVVVSTTSSVLVPISKTLGEGVTAELLGRRSPALAQPLALASLALLAVASATFAFAVTRARRLFGPGGATGRLGRVRIVFLDVALPASVLIGLPLAFSRHLDRAETLSTASFWRLVVRGMPDAGALVVAALLLRLAAGVYGVMRRSSDRTGSLRLRRGA